VCRQAKELILQPQSELERVRAYLWTNGYVILEEDMVLEDEKFYPMMRVQYQGINDEKSAENMLFCRYGKGLLLKKHPVLKEYLLREQTLYADIRENLSKTAVSEKTKERLLEVEAVLELNREGLLLWENEK